MRWNKRTVDIYTPPLLLMGLAFAWTYLGARLYFPHLSINHDEMAYLFQAKLLLEGKLFLVENELSPFFKIWLQEPLNGKLVIKYTPVFASMLALAKLFFGSFRSAIAGIAAANVGLSYLVARELKFTRQTAALSCCFVFLSPLFLIQSLTYLSYSAFLMLALLFACFWLKAENKNKKSLFTFAGLTLGIAFFCRPYDAVLFSFPFLAFFVYKHKNNRNQLRARAWHFLFGFVPILILILWHNHFLTGNALRFPFKQDALDSFGFGPKRMFRHQNTIYYGLGGALRTLKTWFTHIWMWSFGGPAAGILIAWLFVHRDTRKLTYFPLCLAAIFPLGYFFFWGPFNTELWGGAYFMGPFYYFPMVVPISILSAYAINKLFKSSYRAAVLSLIAMALISGLCLYDASQRNLQYQKKQLVMYAPIHEKRLNNAVVFVMPFDGAQLNHPFSRLANDPGPDFTSPLLYAANLHNWNFKLLEALPGRNFFRFEYYGKDPLDLMEEAQTGLVPLTVQKSTSLKIPFHVRNLSAAPFVYVYVKSGWQIQSYLVDQNSSYGSTYDLVWEITATQARLLRPHSRKALATLKDFEEGDALIVGVLFSDNKKISQSVTHELKYDFKMPADGSIHILTPPEMWEKTPVSQNKWLLHNPAQDFGITPSQGH